MACKLAKIEVPSSCGPFSLLSQWIDEFKQQTKQLIVPFNLATSSKNGEVKNRCINLQKLTNDGIIFNTISNSPKIKHINENPLVAANFLFIYPEVGKESIWMTRQVRIEGILEKLPKKCSEEIFNNQPFYAKVRSLFCSHTGAEVEWDEQKQKLDAFLEEVHNNKIELKAPDHLVVYKIVPKSFDFYEASKDEIADRLLFKQQGVDWNCNHLSA